MNVRTWLVALLAALALTLSACGGGDGDGGDGGDGDGNGGDEGTTLSVQAKEFEFTPSTLTAPADTEVTVELENAGTIEHDFALDEADLVVLAPATESASGTFSLPAGSYTFYCSIPGHREAGMEGSLTVS
ncbi:MAG TPA: cupredoxin domain-containing protein [Actinomycetota bacterium]|nr:cupredoxin domain-containing protein [Actinomycetota bacterium]